MNVILFDFIIFYIFCYFRILISLKPFINNIWYLISKLNQVKKMCHLQIYIYTNYTYTKAKKSKAQRLFFFSRENATIGKNCRKKRLYKTGDENQNEQINHHYKSKLKNCRRAWKCTHFQHIPHGISEFKRRRAISYGMYLRRVCVCVCFCFHVVRQRGVFRCGCFTYHMECMLWRVTLYIGNNFFRITACQKQAQPKMSEKQREWKGVTRRTGKGPGRKKSTLLNYIL